LLLTTMTTRTHCVGRGLNQAFAYVNATRIGIHDLLHFEFIFYEHYQRNGQNDNRKSAQCAHDDVSDDERAVAHFVGMHRVSTLFAISDGEIDLCCLVADKKFTLIELEIQVEPRVHVSRRVRVHHKP